MKVEFSSAFFQANRQRLRALFAGTAPIVLTANGLLQRNSDVVYPFRQDSNFWYLTGIEDPDIVLVIDRNKEYLIVSDRDEIRQAFDGQINHQRLIDTSGIETIYGEKEGWKKLSIKLKKVKYVATLPAPVAYDPHQGIFTNPAKAHLSRRLKEINATVELLDLRPQLAKMRVVKQPDEIKAMTAAINLTVKAFRKIERSIDDIDHEHDVRTILDKTFIKQGATHAYQPVIAGGIRACTLHYVQNNQSLMEGQLVLIDSGAELHNYAADITRTYCKGQMSKRQRAVIGAVNEALLLGIGELRPGVSFASCEQKVRDFIGEKLRELGLIKSITKETIAQFYPHSPHFLGLDVHDVGDYQAPLEPGMIMTLEPGIYIPAEGIGVRIEDNILITKKGNKVLSESLSRTGW